jgi:5-oxoprolinase (ATP-hydrolysing) subunit A
MSVPHIDLNADLGEGFGRWQLGSDEAILQLVSSANVACGFHAGDPSIMRSVFSLAVQRGVSIGAHVGYPDLAGFGRRYMDVEPAVLTDGILYQVGAATALAAAVGATIAYVKPHGALYHTIVSDPRQAAAVVSAIRSLDGDMPLVTQAGSVVAGLCLRAGIPVVAEAFVDRAYQSDGRLVPRGLPGAVIHEPGQAARRAVQLVTEGTVVAIDGTVIAVAAQTLCTHGDTSDAAELLGQVRNALQERGIEVRAFA